MLTAAVRDLHRAYPNQFLTDVRTFSPEIWEHNPHLTQLSDDDPDAEQIDCSCPLINVADRVPYHCLHGFIHFLNTKLRLRIKLTAARGDIHLSERERAWYSQVRELTGADTPFWIVSAGGKYDVTVKWWDTKRYQQVVDHFHGKVAFVQVGREGHHHPKLNGVIDLRGKTSLRELIRLVFHSQGVLCPITALMHLAAAVPTRHGPRLARPCVVVAGGREPAHWEAYPGHQFIHVNGALDCCSRGGCWRDRTIPLRDGDPRDRQDCLCVDVVSELPRCMDMISPEEVIRRVEWYYSGGVIKPLTVRQQNAVESAVAATARNDYDRQPLTIHNSGLACDQFAKMIPAYPGTFKGRGVVICGGGVRYFTSAWVCINMLRRLGCNLPVELWHMGKDEVDDEMKALVAPLGVECVDARRFRKTSPVRMLGGWPLKCYAILNSRFREVMLLDADNVPVLNPEFLFEVPQFKETGAIFWPDYEHGKNRRAAAIWRSCCGTRPPNEHEFETGQIVVDKERCWRALKLCMRLNENSDFYYRYVHGDKETFHLAFRKLGQPYNLVPVPVHGLDATMCQHDFEGRRIFQHRNMDKWDLLSCNRRIRDFWFEEECFGFVAQLRRIWDGKPGRAKTMPRSRNRSSRRLRCPRIQAVLISCPEREKLRLETLANLAKTDWGDLPIHVQIDAGTGNDHERRQTRCAFLGLRAALECEADYALFLEDDLEFNNHIRHNLLQWGPVKRRELTLGGLYNPRLRELACDATNRARTVASGSIFGSQAFLLSMRTVAHVVDHWHDVPGKQDIKISRLAGRLPRPILYHAPSLVQHVGSESVWGGRFHQAADYDPAWKA